MDLKFEIPKIPDEIIDHCWYFDNKNPNKTIEDCLKHYDKWVLYIKDDKERLLKYGVELLTFAIEEHNLDLIEDIYKKSSAYYQVFEGGTVNRSQYMIQLPDGNTNMFVDFGTALFAMYLFLTGDSSALSKWTYKDNPSLVILIVLFSLLIVVYLMNLLIGLLNNAIEKDNNKTSYLVQKAESYSSTINRIYNLDAKYTQIPVAFANISTARKETPIRTIDQATTIKVHKKNVWITSIGKNKSYHLEQSLIDLQLWEPVDIEEYLPTDPIAQWLQLQFWPKNPDRLSSLQFTGLLPLKFMVQTRQLRASHPDIHYASALFRYEKEFSVKFRKITNLVFLDDKNHCKVGESGFSVAAVERGKKVVILIILLRSNSSTTFNSWKNPVEHIMSILNLGLQSVGLMRAEMNDESEKYFKIAMENPTLGEDLIDSLQSPICLVNDIFNHQSLKSEPFKTCLMRAEMNDESEKLISKCDTMNEIQN
ncbi:hypothetical protein RhiirA4_508449 [Rhizophagus irregularis]|uniref:Ion transport domain-containing protein n=1 Tax=Rhizophagus irregularis TaxID=588596 RepID=A0A2I1G8X8_9GLOM|nr:hypothetical protein RhiirA4_508449 [Rhizophagus irregularis]